MNSEGGTFCMDEAAAAEAEADANIFVEAFLKLRKKNIYLRFSF